LSIGVTDIERTAPVIVRTLVEAGASLVSVVPEEAPLEDVYLRLLAGDEQ
jgi:hypothetical protein